MAKYLIDQICQSACAIPIPILSTGLSVVSVLLFYVLLPVFVLVLAMCFQMPVEGPMVKRIKQASRQRARSRNQKQSAATIVALGMAWAKQGKDF